MRRFVTAVVLGTCLCVPAPAGADLLAVDFDGLWLVADDGSSREVLAFGATSPSWSPDGERFVAEVVGEDERSRLAVGRPGGALTPLPGGEGLAEPAWSPDGSTIAAMRRRSERDRDLSDLVLVPAAGGTPQTITTAALDASPAWSPDGAELAFTRFTRVPGQGAYSVELMAVRADGTGVRRLAADGYDPSWSPDGRQIVFASARDRNGQTCFHDCTPNGELYVVGADGSGERRLTVTEADESGPAWSPDGTRIAFSSDRHYPDGRSPELFVMDADGGCVTQLTLGPNNMREPAWRPARPVVRGPCGVRLAPYHDTVDVTAVRARNVVPLFAGREFGGMRITGTYRRGVIYDECELPDPAACAREIQIQNETTCARNPAVIDLPVSRVRRIHGALAVEYGRDRIEIFSGGTTTVIFHFLPEPQLRRLVAALRPVSVPDAALPRLPAPRLPSYAWLALRRSRKIRDDPVVVPRSQIVRSDRRVLRALERFGPRRRPACER